MQNVSVFEVNSGIGTISDNLGFYKLLLKSDSVCLQISNTGFDVVTESFELYAIQYCLFIFFLKNQ